MSNTTDWVAASVHKHPKGQPGSIQELLDHCEAQISQYRRQERDAAMAAEIWILVRGVVENVDSNQEALQQCSLEAGPLRARVLVLETALCDLIERFDDPAMGANDLRAIAARALGAIQAPKDVAPADKQSKP